MFINILCIHYWILEFPKLMDRLYLSNIFKNNDIVIEIVSNYISTFMLL